MARGLSSKEKSKDKKVQTKKIKGTEKPNSAQKNVATVKRVKPHLPQGIDFPVVGIGASAGGLEAFTNLLSQLPKDTGMAFVLIQHMDPKHESMSPEILSRISKMKVTEVEDGMSVQPNSIYIIPPGFDMEIYHGDLKLSPRTEVRGQHLVIDTFLTSLSEDLKDLAIGVVLSGTGADGTFGLKAIKAEGGITFAQEPKSAKFDNMPQSAIASGSVDLVLPPEEIARELMRIAHHPLAFPPAHKVTNKEETKDESKDETDVEKVDEDNQNSKPHPSQTHIFLLLRKHCHVDFSLYKSNTVKRRIERRMVLQKIDTIAAYADFLSQNPNEVKALYEDMLIHVTGFFRDPKAFEAMKVEVFPKLMEKRPPGVPIRIWVPGCSTGEEVYSIAIALIEYLGERASHTPIQIFASDVSEQAIQKARIGEYPENISGSVSSERLSRFFLKVDGHGYKVAKSIRDVCVFSRHDITTDPPFARIDFISCRNLLIYFAPPLQKHVIAIFHYSLVARGLLCLGMSETIGGASDRFSLIDKTNKIYARKDTPTSTSLHFPSSTYVHGRQDLALAPRTFAKVNGDVQKIAEQALQSEYPGVLVNEEFEILQVRGRPAPFIELVPGAASFHLFRMVHPDLLRELKATIEEAKKSKRSVRKFGLTLEEGRNLKTFNLNVIPAGSPKGAKLGLYLILFEITKTPQAKSKLKAAPSSAKNRKAQGKKDPYLVELQRELADLQEYQRALSEKYEATQEDLTATNEELQSANEELQSTNEEMETAKEELQSGNEELTTVNDELQLRSIEQAQTNNDLINLLGSVEIPIVMLGDDQRIRRFTPLAGKALNLIATDVGRPISDLKLNFVSPSGEIDLHRMVSTTIETIVSQEVEVTDRKGHWFRLQVRPYKTIDNKIDGAVLALVDINDLKLSLFNVKAAQAEAEKANRAKDLFLATLSHELRTPLTSILSWAQLLRSGKLSEEKANRAIEIIEENGKIQAQLISDLLDVSRIISGKISLVTHEVDPTSIVLAAVEAIRSTAEAKSIQIDTFFAPNVGLVMADPMRLQQVFWNLLTNAVKFSAPSSKVTIRMERVEDRDGEKARAMIRVEDSGKGIDPLFLPLIFDRFSQEDNSSVRVHGGLGLGLSIVKDIVALHGGSIHAESLGENRGASFTVMLPIITGPATATSQNFQTTPMQVLRNTTATLPNLEGIRILLVDDEPHAREAYEELLSSLGAEVKTAGSASDGFDIFGRFKPHVLVSDIAMPGEDGYSLIKKVRAFSKAAGGNTPAIAMTAFAADTDVQRALSAGFQFHLAKPVEGHNLANTIAKLVAGDKP